MMKSQECELINQTADGCVQCGACRPICPVHKLTRREEHAPRAKLKLYQALLNGRAQLSTANLRPLRQCLLCGRCQKNCPSKIEVTNAFKQGRAWLRHKNSILARVLGKVLLHPKLPFFMKSAWPLKKALSRGLDLRLKPLRRLPALRQRPPAQQPVPGPAAGPRMGLFLGCMATYARPGLAEKAINLLSQIGPVEPLSGCCGLAAQSSGDSAGLRRASDNLRHNCAGRKLDFIVTICTSCAHSLEHEQRAYNAAMSPIIDISQLLAEHMSLIKNKALIREVNLHVSCHQEADKPLQAWLQQAGVSFKVIDACCGGGGLLPLTNPVLSQRIMPTLPASPIPLVTTCSGCYLQWLQSQASQVLHPLELLAGV